MQLTRNSNLVNLAEGFDTPPIRHAMEDLCRDLSFACAPGMEPGADIRLVRRDGLPWEGYSISEQDGALEIGAADTLGFVYGLYAVSRELLGVQDFWFWNDQPFIQRAGITVPEGWRLESKPFAVRYCGWFINDEVLLHTWIVDRKPEKPWQMAFEALLRCGGNMVIPGTDKNARKYRSAAAERGLIITHHHAEPLGAEMFARAYPGLSASYAEHPDKFHSLWLQALEEQSGYRVIWNLGFRGQGDRPFWEDDPQYATPEARGKLMGELIGLQYRRALRNDWKESLLPGVLSGVFLTLWLFEACALAGEHGIPVMALAVLLETAFLWMGVLNYVFSQITLVKVSAWRLWTNSIRLFAGTLPTAAGAVMLQMCYWGVFLLLLPRSVPFLLVGGF